MHSPSKFLQKRFPLLFPWCIWLHRLYVVDAPAGNKVEFNTLLKVMWCRNRQQIGNVQLCCRFSATTWIRQLLAVDFVAIASVRGQSHTVDFVDFQQSRPCWTPVSAVLLQPTPAGGEGLPALVSNYPSHRSRSFGPCCVCPCLKVFPEIAASAYSRSWSNRRVFDASDSGKTGWIQTCRQGTAVTLCHICQRWPNALLKVFIARQHTDARYWYSISVRLSVRPWRSGIR